MRTGVLGLVVITLSGCNDPVSDATILNWRDETDGTTYRVTTRPVGIKTNSKLHVESSGHTQSKDIDDDAMWGTIAFLRYNNWILVLDDSYVLAGYDMTSKTLYGENEWDHLPFTVRKGAGTILASKSIGKEAALPAKFPRVDEK